MLKEAILTAFLSLILLTITATAGDDVTAELAQIDTSNYPDITLYVSVTDGGGVPVDGLQQNEFQITEDGEPVEIIDFSAGGSSSIATVLTIDRSGSMDVEGKLDGAKNAALTFVDLMRRQDQAAIIVFDSSVDIVQPFTSDKFVLQGHIRDIYIGGCTAWYDGVYDSVDLMLTAEGRRSIILLTDGIDCREDFFRRMSGEGSENTLESAITHAANSGIPIYAIGLGEQVSQEVSNEGYDEEKLRRVASSTGGKFYHAPNAKELEELYRSLSVVMQQEYVLTYRSPRPTYDGTHRDIVVAIAGDSGGSTVASGGYLEKHLINFQSDWRWFLLLLTPLLLALVIPVVGGRDIIQRGQKDKDSVPVQTIEDRPQTNTSQKPAPQGERDETTDYPSSLTCHSCGKSLKPNAKFCGACGSKTKAPYPGPPPIHTSAPQTSPGQDYCPDCGQPVRAGARFCGGCGHKFA